MVNIFWEKSNWNRSFWSISELRNSKFSSTMVNIFRENFIISNLQFSRFLNSILSQSVSGPTHNVMKVLCKWTHIYMMKVRHTRNPGKNPRIVGLGDPKLGWGLNKGLGVGCRHKLWIVTDGVPYFSIWFEIDVYFLFPHYCSISIGNVVCDELED